MYIAKLQFLYPIFLSGVPPTDAREFMDFFESSTFNLSHIHYTVLALGDTNYPHFCKTGKQLDHRYFTSQNVSGDDNDIMHVVETLNGIRIKIKG